MNNDDFADWLFSTTVRNAISHAAEVLLGDNYGLEATTRSGDLDDRDRPLTAELQIKERNAR